MRREFNVGSSLASQLETVKRQNIHIEFKEAKMNSYLKQVSSFYKFLCSGIFLSTLVVGCSGGNTVSDIDGNEYRIV
jgi:hypothetical protein